MEGQRAALHAAHERVLVERVAAHDLGAAARQRVGCRVRARERDDVVPAHDEPLDERATDHSAATRDEDAAHEVERSEAENFSR